MWCDFRDYACMPQTKIMSMRATKQLHGMKDVPYLEIGILKILTLPNLAHRRDRGT